MFAIEDALSVTRCVCRFANLSCARISTSRAHQRTNCRTSTFVSSSSFLLRVIQIRRCFFTNRPTITPCAPRILHTGPIVNAATLPSRCRRHEYESSARFLVSSSEEVCILTNVPGDFVVYFSLHLLNYQHQNIRMTLYDPRTFVAFF